MIYVPSGIIILFSSLGWGLRQQRTLFHVMPSVFLLGYFLLLSHSSLKKKPIYSVWERKLIIRGEERSLEKVYPQQKEKFPFKNSEASIHIWKHGNCLEIVKLIVYDQKYFMFDSSRDIKEAVMDFQITTKIFIFFSQIFLQVILQRM